MRAVDAALSGLEAATTRFGVTAANVANVNTPGYAPYRADAQDQAQGGVRVTISREALAKADAALGLSGTDLVQETVNRRTELAAFRANLAVIRSARAMDAAVADIGEPSGR